MKTENTHDKDWKQEAPFLSSLDPEEMRGTVPEGYFDRLQERVMNRIREEEAEDSGKKDTKIIRFRRMSWLAAAAVAILAVTGLYFSIPGSDLPEATAFGNLEVEEIFAALEFSDLYEEDILAYISDETLNNLGPAPNPDDDTFLHYLDEIDLDDLDFDNLDLEAIEF